MFFQSVVNSRVDLLAVLVLYDSYRHIDHDGRKVLFQAAANYSNIFPRPLQPPRSLNVLANRGKS
jgi:hypothetical protein